VLEGPAFFIHILILFMLAAVAALAILFMVLVGVAGDLGEAELVARPVMELLVLLALQEL
jgi:hypothetical protein